MQNESQNLSYHYYPKAVTFGFLTTGDVKKISVVDIRNPDSFNQLGTPNTGGLYDPAMGPYDRYKRTNCGTCQLNFNHCPGHYGHIDLPLPTFHPLFQRTVIKILKQACPVCRRFLYSGNLLVHVLNAELFDWVFICLWSIYIIYYILFLQQTD